MMSIQEQIIAFLDGELNSEADAAELMHVLAVSPEKRNFLIESAQMQRAFGTMGSTITPSTAIDQAILAGIAGIDVGLPAANASHPSELPPEFPSVGTTSTEETSVVRRRGLFGLAGILLVGVGLTVGYLIGGDQSSAITSTNAVPATTITSSSVTASPAAVPATSLASVTASDSLAALREKILSLQNALAARPVRTIVRYLHGSTATERRPIASAQMIDSSSHSDIVQPAHPATSMQADERATVTAVAIQQASPLPPATSSRDTTLLRSSTREASKIPVAEASSNESTERRWHVGIRNNIRTSLPKIYGLATRQNILTDREIQGGVRFEEGFLGLRTPVGVGAAFGGTRFSQIFQVREGGASVNTVIEQTPNLLYARAWLAPQILSSTAWSGSIEIGGGGTEIGPFVSLGLDAEWRPIDLVSVHGGASSWLMWSAAQLQTSLSSNLNGYMGVSYWF